MIGDEEQPGANEVVPVPSAKGENRIAFGGLQTLGEDEEEEEEEEDFGELALPAFSARVSSMFLSSRTLDNTVTSSSTTGSRNRSGGGGLSKGPSLFFQRAAGAASTRSGLHNTSMDTIALDRRASISTSKEDFGDHYREKKPFCTVNRAVTFFFVATLLGVVIYLAYIFIDVKFEKKGSGGGVSLPTISLDTDAMSQSRTQVISEEAVKVNVGDVGEPITANKLADLVEKHLKIQPQPNSVDATNLFSIETEDGDTIYCGVIVDALPVVIECLHTKMRCQVYLYEQGSPPTNCGASSS